MPMVIPIVAGVAGAAIGGAIGAAVGGAVLGIGAATIGAYIGSTVLGTLGSVLAGQMADGPSASLSAPEREAPSRARTQSSRAATGPRRHGFGRARVAAQGTVSYATTEAGDFIRGLILNDGPIEGVVRHELQREGVTLNGAGWVTGSPDGKWDGQRVRVQVTSGAAGQSAPSLLLAHDPSWTSDHRCRGLAVAQVLQRPVAVDDARARHVHQELTYTAVVDLASDVHDPRDGGTRWTDNAALIAMWHLLHPAGYALSLGDLALDTWRAAADICDEALARADGTFERRYRAAGSFSAVEDPQDVLTDLLACFDGRVVIDGDGRVAVQVGDEPSASAVRLGGDVVLASEFAGRPAIEVANRIVSVIPSEAHDHTDVSITWDDAAAVAADGALVDQMALRFCPSPTQAMRLMKRRLIRGRGEVGVLRCTLDALPATPGRSVVLDYDGRETARPLRVVSRRIDQAVVTLEVQEIPAGAEDWDPQSEELDVAGFTRQPIAAGLIQAPTGVTVVAGGEQLNSSQVSSGVTIGWNAPTAIPGATLYDPSVILAHVQTSVDGGGVWKDVRRVPATARTVVASPISDSADVLARVRFVGPSGAATAWTSASEGSVTASSATTSITAPALTVPLLAFETSGVRLEWTEPDTPRLRNTRLYQHTADDFSSATQITGVPWGAPGQARVFNVNGLSSGTYYFWSAAIDQSGEQGPESASASVTVQAGSPSQ